MLFTQPSRAQQYEHHQKKEGGNRKAKPTAMLEFTQVRYQKSPLNGKEQQGHRYCSYC